MADGSRYHERYQSPPYAVTAIISLFISLLPRCRHAIACRAMLHTAAATPLIA